MGRSRRPEVHGRSGAPNGQKLFFVAPDGAMMAVRVDPRGERMEPGQPDEAVRGAVRDRGPGKQPEL